MNGSESPDRRRFAAAPGKAQAVSRVAVLCNMVVSVAIACSP
jgi:hypothetical protein